ncbi:MAG: TRAP transporter small permease [Bacillota bacterium]
MKIIYSLSRLMGYLSTGVLSVLMILIVADVLARFLFNAPIPGAPELSELLMVILVFPALAWCALEGKHVRVELFVSRFSRRARAVLDSLTLLAALGTYVVICWRTVLESLGVVTRTSLLRVPHAPFYWVMTAGLAVFCLSIAVLVVKNVGEAAKK